MTAIAGLAAAALAAWLAACGFLYAKQESLLFYPEPLPADFSFSPLFPPEQAFDELSIPVEGGRLSALLLRQPASRGLVFYLHGNGGNVAGWTRHHAFWRETGFDLLMLDYRGYGKSPGRIESEAQLHADVRAAWDLVAPRYAGRPVAILGRSLGSGLALALAHDVRPDLVVLVTPYASLSTLAREQFPWLPPGLLKYPLDGEAIVASVEAPLLMLYGDRDTLIPPAHPQRLAAARGARPDDAFVPVEGAGHNDIQEFPAYRDALRARLEQLGLPENP